MLRIFNLCSYHSHLQICYGICYGEHESSEDRKSYVGQHMIAAGNPSIIFYTFRCFESGSTFTRSIKPIQQTLRISSEIIICRLQQLAIILFVTWFSRRCTLYNTIDHQKLKYTSKIPREPDWQQNIHHFMWNIPSLRWRHKHYDLCQISRKHYQQYDTTHTCISLCDVTRVTSQKL